MSEDRTWLATVLFLDIVGYSQKPVDQQLTVKRHFQQQVANAIIGILEDDNTIRLDTGDGMAICYLGDPEKIYPIARGLRDGFASLSGAAPGYEVRMGMNLGPIKIIEDLNKGRNCIGSGINDAERVMSFAGPNQLLVSRSYFEMVSKMSQDYGQQLRHLGTRADKHEQQHEVYELAVDVVSVSGFGAGAGAAVSAAAVPVSSLDAQAVDRIRAEFAKYVGSSEAERIVAETAPQASSINDLCARLKQTLGEDDRYNFNEYLKYYGYAGY
jgi:class 3 adenylate cyclase